jgi:hypothetical protein
MRSWQCSARLFVFMEGKWGRLCIETVGNQGPTHQKNKEQVSCRWLHKRQDFQCNANPAAIKSDGLAEGRNIARCV